MTHEKERENVEKFFGYLYANIQECVQPDVKNNAKNGKCFEKGYLAMAEAFMDAEDSCYINWERMWKSLSLLDIMSSGMKDGKTEKPGETFEKYKDIDIFFGILHQCMVTISKHKMNEGNQEFIKNVFERTKEKFKRPEYANGIPWDWMWQMLMNSGVYAKVVEEMRENSRNDYLKKDLYLGNEDFFNILISEDTKKKSYSRFTCILKSNYIGFDRPYADGTERMRALKEGL